MRMRIRTRLVAAVLAVGTLTGVVAMSTSAASAEPTAAAVEDKAANPEQGKPEQGKPDEGKPVKDKPGEGKPGDGKPGKDKPGEGKPGVPQEAVKLLAAELGITVDRARQVFQDLEKVEARGDEILEDRAFVAIADGLGITPEHLLDVLRKVKQAIAGEPKPAPKRDEVPSDAPGK
ncbi:hypothetical protein AB0G02_23235 [Actinosynnema sp. NPDC023658]|uniref:hypothetical protein n=1 Tax=Actinosynnema sp. NPDC023658 TaxID=3155465 RepID=UPI0033DBD709